MGFTEFLIDFGVVYRMLFCSLLFSDVWIIAAIVSMSFCDRLHSAYHCQLAAIMRVNIATIV